MAIDYTTDALIARIENDILDDLSDTSTPFTTDQALEIATDVLREECAPFLKNLHEEYGVARTDVSLVADQRAYDIPEYAMAANLRDVTIIDSNSVEYSLDQLSYDDVRGRTYAGSPFSASAGLYGYYLEANKVNLIPTPTSSQTNLTLRLSYYRRPNVLTQTANARQISSFTGDTATLVSSAPAAWTTNDTFTTQKHKPHFDLIVPVHGASTVSGTTFTYDSTPSETPASNDWIMLEGYAVIPELPAEAHPWLASLVASEILKARGDTEGATVLFGKAEMRRERLERAFTPRNTGEPKKLVNRYSLLRRLGDRRPYGYGSS